MAVKVQYKPHQYQQLIHNSCSTKSPNFWTVVCSGRQSGKTRANIYQAIKWAWENEKSVIWYVTPNEGLGADIFMEMVEILEPMEIITRKVASKGRFQIELSNKSKIIFKSAAAKDSLRGSGVWFLILDECAFIEQSTIELVILPTMAAVGKKILVTSTPKGKNFFYKLWSRGQGDNPNYKSFKFNTYDNPYPSKDKPIVDGFKQDMPKEVFAQEFLAEWTDGAAVFTNIEELCILNSIQGGLKGESYFIGVDIALKNDYTVITVINSKGEMVHMDRFRGLETPDVLDRINHINSKFKPKKLVIESNNQGLPIIQMLEIPVKAFNTSPDSKHMIITQLIAAFSGKEIKCLNNDDLRKELTAFVFDYSKSGRLLLHAAPGFHDDCVMSLAIAWDAYIKNTKTGDYSFFTVDTLQDKKKDLRGGI